MEKIQQNVALTMIGAIRYISKEKLNYQELGIEALHQRQSYRKLCNFFKIFKNQSPCHLFNMVTKSKRNYQSRNCEKLFFPCQ